jgi:cholesterol oxidase
MIDILSTLKRVPPGERNIRGYSNQKGLIISGGVLGTMNLLLRQKYLYNSLPNLSNHLGENILTNSESLCGVSGTDRKLNNGVAISSYFNPDDHTHIEVVKYNDKSGRWVD